MDTCVLHTHEHEDSHVCTTQRPAREKKWSTFWVNTETQTGEDLKIKIVGLERWFRG